MTIVLPSTIAQPIISSDALTPIELNDIFQAVTLAILGLDPNVVANAWAAARIKWETEGQPAWDIDEDIVFLGITEQEDEINRNHDIEYKETVDPAIVLRVITYMRVWSVTWTLYGPNSSDRARAIRSGLNEQVNEDAFQQNSLAMIPDYPATTRQPELFNGQWWERTDFTILYNELVTETVQINTVKSVEIIIEDAKGVQDDFTVTNPNS